MQEQTPNELSKDTMAQVQAPSQTTSNQVPQAQENIHQQQPTGMPVVYQYVPQQQTYIQNTQQPMVQQEQFLSGQQISNQQQVIFQVPQVYEQQQKIRFKPLPAGSCDCTVTFLGSIAQGQEFDVVGQPLYNVRLDNNCCDRNVLVTFNQQEYLSLTSGGCCSERINVKAGQQGDVGYLEARSCTCEPFRNQRVEYHETNGNVLYYFGQPDCSCEGENCGCNSGGCCDLSCSDKSYWSLPVRNPTDQVIGSVDYMMYKPCCKAPQWRVDINPQKQDISLFRFLISIMLMGGVGQNNSKQCLIRYAIMFFVCMMIIIIASA